MPVIQTFSSPPPSPHLIEADFTISIGGDVNVQPASATGANFRVKIGGDVNVSGAFVFEIPPPFTDEIEDGAFSKQLYTARLRDNSGNIILITDASRDKPKGEIGERISLTVGHKDLNQISLERLYTFEIGTWDTIVSLLAGDEPDWEPICEDARLETRKFSVGRRGGLPADSLSFEIVESSKNRLNYFPVRNYILYDSLVTEVSVNDTEKTDTSDGDYIRTTANAFPNLTYYKILQFIKERCAFAGIETNIPNFPVIRADFPFNQSYAKSLAGSSGTYEPIFSVQPGNILRVQTKFADLPDDFQPVEITVNDYSNLSLDISESAHVDGVRINFIQSSALADDFYDLDEQPVILPSGGAYGDENYSETRIVKRYRHWTDEDGDEIDKKLIRETHSVYDNLGNLTDRVITDYFYDASAAQTAKNQTKESTVPDLAAVPPAAVLLETKTIVQTTSYVNDPRNPKRRIPDKVITQVAGMIGIDSTNPAIGASGEPEPYENDFEKLYEHGMVNSDTTSRFGAIETTVKTLTPIGNNQYEWRVQVRDEIRRKTKYLESEPVTGDPSINAVGGKARRYILWADGVGINSRTGGEIIELYGGEIPLRLLKILAGIVLTRRLNGFQDGSVTIPGYHSSLDRGVFFRILDRDGNSYGRFIAEAVRNDFQRLGVAKQQRVTTVCSISEV